MKKRLYTVNGKYFGSEDSAIQYLMKNFTTVTVSDKKGGCREASWAAGLRRIAQGTYTPVPIRKNLPEQVSFVEKMSPIYDQASRGTCAANAATALMEYYIAKSQRLSVQYLYERVKIEELETYRTAAAEVSAGKIPSDPDLAQLAVHVGEGRLDDLSKAWRKVRIEKDGGSNAKYVFRVLENYGICSYDFWPYAREQIDLLDEVNDFTERAVPPGADADAKRRRLNDEYYIFPSPNNVEEIKSYLAGSARYKPMPVYIGALVFSKEGKCLPLENEVLYMPKVEVVEISSIECDVEKIRLDDDEYKIKSADPDTIKTVGKIDVIDMHPDGGHAMLLVGYEDDESVPGGGYFIVRNSWGENWGNGGYAKMPYAYAELFVISAATILVPNEDNFELSVSCTDDEWKAYAVKADSDMKNRKGLKNILKGDRILMNPEEGVADADTPENRVIFKRHGYRWSPVDAGDEGASGGSATVGIDASSSELEFFTNLELSFKRFPPAFPYLGGIRKPRIFGKDVSVEKCEKEAEIQVEQDCRMRIYSVRGRGTVFRIAALYIGDSADAAVVSEKARRMFVEYNGRQRFDPCKCSMMLVGASKNISGQVMAYTSDDDVRIVVDSHVRESGWSVSASAKSDDENWCKWVLALCPNSVEQNRSRVLSVWNGIDAAGGHVTVEKLSAGTGFSPEVLLYLIEKDIPALKIKGGKVVKV